MKPTEKISPRENATRYLTFPCCQCGLGIQEEQISFAVKAAWQHKDDSPLQYFSEAVSPNLQHPLVLAATLLAYLPESAFKELVPKIEQVNVEMADLHCKMRRRQVSIHSDQDPSFNTLEQAAVVCMLEENYRYTTHPGSIGGCTLANFYYTDACSRFVA